MGGLEVQDPSHIQQRMSVLQTSNICFLEIGCAGGDPLALKVCWRIRNLLIFSVGRAHKGQQSLYNIG